MKTLSLRSGPVSAILFALALPTAACKDQPVDAMGDTETGGPVVDTDGTADDTGTGTTDGMDGINVIPPPGGMHRLTPGQYTASVELLLGADVAAAANPPPLPQLGTFDAQTVNEQPLTPTDVERYESSAMAIGNAVMADPSGLATLVPCVTSGGGESCYQSIATDLGRVAWRRPLTQEEVDQLVAIGLAGQAWSDTGDFLTGVKYEVSAILQSPNFLYVVEVGEPTGDGDIRELTQYEMAARLSFFLLGRTPDLALLDQAEAGQLGTEDEIRAAAQSMLELPEARDRLAGFFDELYRLRDLETKGKDATLFPNFSPELAAAMRQETLLLIQNVVFEEESNFLSIFDASYTFVNDDLAQLYGLAAPAFPWQIVPLPAEQGRAGILTQGAFLSVFSHPDENSPTRRGLFVQETLLCTDIQPPPPDVNPMPPQPTEGQTLRQWLEETHNTEGCASCHGLMDPIGFAFEHFDAIGQFRTLDNGLPIDSSGQVSGLGNFADATDLAGLVRGDQRTPICVVRNLYRATLGHQEGFDQAEGINILDEAFSNTSYNYKALLVELTVNPLFRLVDAPK